MRDELEEARATLEREERERERDEEEEERAETGQLGEAERKWCGWTKFEGADEAGEIDGGSRVRLGGR